MSDTGDVLVTATEARDTYGIPAQRTRKWSYEERIQPRGFRGRFKLYRLSELSALNYLADMDPRSKQ